MASPSVSPCLCVHEKKRFLQSQRMDVAVCLAHLVLNALGRIVAADVIHLLRIKLKRGLHVFLRTVHVTLLILYGSPLAEGVGAERVDLYHPAVRLQGFAGVSGGTKFSVSSPDS